MNSYRREIKNNEGYSTFSLAFSICSVGLGFLGMGVPDLAYVSLFLGALAVLLGILALLDKVQKRKYYATVALVLGPVGMAIALYSIFILRSK